MVIPKQSEIEVPLLEVLVSLGGQGKPREIYPLVTNKFQNLTQEDLEERVESGQNKWTIQIQWARQKLVSKGEIDNTQRGIWVITEKGRNRIQSDVSTSAAELVPLIF